MMSLLRVEWRRMWARRLPWVLIIVMSGALLVSGVATFATHRPEKPNEASVADQRARDVEQCRLFSVQEWEQFDDGTLIGADAGYLEFLGSFPSAEAYADNNCNPNNFGYYVEDPRFCLVSLYEPTVQWRQGCPDLEESEVSEYVEQTFIVNGVEYRSAKPNASGIIPTTSLLLLALAAVIGASFIGAEYAAGTIETTLLWEPRRRRVLAAKLTVASLTAFLFQILMLSLLVVFMLPSAQWRGSTAGVDSDFWIGLAGVIVRGGIVAAAVAAIALCISTITRGTVGGVVALIGYIAVSPTLAYTLLKGFRPFDLTENMTSFANGGEVGRFVTNQDGYLATVFAHGGGISLVIVGIYVAIAVAIGMAVFARRDID